MNLFKIVGCAVSLVFVAIIASWLFIGILFCKGCKTVQNDGLKGVAHVVWNGTNEVAMPQAAKVEK